MSDGDDDTLRRDSAPGASHRDPVIGSEVSGYRVTSRLGAGGMGIVYEGEQPVIGKRVAIKVLRHEVAENPDVVQRLVAEARAVNQVGHRGIIDVFGVGQLPDGRQCIVMEYLDGESLESVIRSFQSKGRLLPVVDVLVILEEVLSALAAAHAAGVVHRDLKPSNIFLCNQRDGSRFVKLLDFGIAKLGVLSHDAPASRVSLMMGTPAYMAPEQAAGGVVSPAMDLYPIGVIAFELLSGRLPFIAESVMAMLMMHAHEPPPPLSRFNLGLPDELGELVMRLLAKKPGERPASADEVRAQLVRIRKTVAHTTGKRISLEVRHDPQRNLETVMRARPAEVSADTMAMPADTIAVAPPEPPAVSQPTAILPRRDVAAQTPEQRRPTEQDLGPPVRSKTPMVAVGALVVAVLGVAGWMLTRGPADETPQPPAATDVARSAADVTKSKEPLAPADTTDVAKSPEPSSAAPPVDLAKPAEPSTPATTADVASSPEPSSAAPDDTAAEPPSPPRADTTKSAEPSAVSKPAVTKRTASAKPARSSLEARLESDAREVEQNLARAKQAGVDAVLFEKSLARVNARLAQKPLSKQEQEDLEVVLSRLLQETRNLSR